jgi:Aspartyl protease
MRAVIPIVIVSLVACALVPRYAAQMMSPPSAAVAVAPPHPDPAPAQSNNASRSVVIEPSRGGRFRVTGRVDGRRIDFMIDTGATAIALKPEDAAMLGIRPIASEYVAAVKTANGVIRVARSNSILSRSRILKCTMSPPWCCRPALRRKTCSACRSCGGCGGSNIPTASSFWNNSGASFRNHSLGQSFRLCRAA